MDKTDRLRDYGLAFLLYEQGLGICGYELIRELFIFIKLILNSYLAIYFFAKLKQNYHKEHENFRQRFTPINNLTFFVLKKLITYILPSRLAQKYTHLEAAGFRWNPAASFVLCLYRSRILGRCNDAIPGFRRSLSIDGCRRDRGKRGFFLGW